MRHPRGSNPLPFLAIAASVLCVAAAACGPSDPLAAIRRQQASGDFAGSLEPLRALLDERRGDPEVLYRYGRALDLTGQPSLAEWPLRKAMDDPEWLVPAALQLAYGALRTSNFSLAIETANRALEADPDNVEVLLLRANAYAHSRLNDEAALADADRVLELDPDDLKAMEPRILALLGLGRIDEVREAMEELGRRIEESQVGPDLPAWYCATSAIFADESGDSELAEQRWTDCLERYPAHPNVVDSALQFYDRQGRFDRSLEIARRAEQEEPTSREYRVLLAARLRRAGQNDEAEAVLREATESDNPGLASAAWIDLAKHQQAVGDYAAAARAVERAVELVRQLGTPPPQLLLEQADSLVLAGEFDRALEVADEMTLTGHREMIRARVAQQRGRPAEALAHFDEAFRVWPDNPWGRYYAAIAAEAVGDFDRAIEEYRYSIRIAASETDARDRITHLLWAEGKPAEALPLLRFQAEKAPLDLEGELLSLRLWARLGLDPQVANSLEVFRRGLPGHLGRALVSAAEGVRERSGDAAAVRALRGWESQGFADLTDPRNADALRALVRFSAAAGSGEEAESSVRAALRAHPDAAVLHEVLGLSLELRAAPDERVREAYERALQLDADNARALAGLGRLALAGDPERALALLDRAAAADPTAVDPQRDAVRALFALGRPQVAEERLASLLERHPYEGEVAARLAELDLARGVATDRTLERARRAVRFRGGADAWDLLSRVYSQRNEPERASRAADRARALRENAAVGAPSAASEAGRWSRDPAGERPESVAARE